MAAADGGALPFSKISIPGPTLSSLLHHALPSSSSGLLFGRLSPLPSPEPTDHDPSPTSSSSSSFCLTLTSFLSSPLPLAFFDPLANLLPSSPLLLSHNSSPDSSSTLVGWFSARPRSPLRPSMRELAVSHRLLSQTLTLDPAPVPSFSVFLLLSSLSTPNDAVHTHEYRAYVLSPPTAALRPVSIDIINVGPKFRGQYEAFTPESSAALFPMVLCPARIPKEGDGHMEVDNGEPAGDKSGATDGAAMEGFGADRLESLAGEKVADYARDLEEMYTQMMGKLEGLVRMVESSSAEIREQESRNSALRSKIAGHE